MSFRKRFAHLEGARPDREDQKRGRTRQRFSGLGGAPAKELCAGCGADLAFGESHDAACPASQPAPGDTHGFGGSHPQWQRPAPAAAPEDREAGIAATTPAWRGDAFPADVAQEVRQKLGIPADQEIHRDDLEAWADRTLRQQRIFGRIAALVAAYFIGQRIYRAIGTVIVFLALLGLLGGAVFARGCATMRGELPEGIHER